MVPRHGGRGAFCSDAVHVAIVPLLALMLMLVLVLIMLLLSTVVLVGVVLLRSIYFNNGVKQYLF